MRRKVGAIAVSTAVLALLVVGLSPTPSSAVDDPDQALAAAQEPIQSATDAIEAQVATRSDWAASYGGAEVFIQNKAVRFYWKKNSNGVFAPDTDFLILVGSYDNGDTVNTAVAASQYSVNELKTAAEAAGSADGDITAISLEGDSSGLVVETEDDTVAAIGNKKIGSSSSTSKLLSPKFSYQRYIKRYEHSSGLTPAVATRENDSGAAPGWKGGARIRWQNSSTNFSLCSTSFGVALSGFEYMITAAHCRGDNQATQDGAGDSVGTTTNRTPGNDYMWIKVSNASNRVYVGAWNNKSGSYKNVTGTVGNTKGTYTCQSGASTGTNCDTKIINENYFYRINGISQWGVRAERQANLRAIGTGDSGGPVLKNTSNPANIKAAGVISAGTNSSVVSCGADVAPGTTCFRQVVYKRIQTARDNGTVITS